MVIKRMCLIRGVCIFVPSLHYSASSTQFSVNLIIYTLVVSIIDGIVKLQDTALGVKM